MFILFIYVFILHIVFILYMFVLHKGYTVAQSICVNHLLTVFIFCSYCKVCSYCVHIAYSVHIMLQKGIYCRSMLFGTQLVCLDSLIQILAHSSCGIVLKLSTTDIHYTQYGRSHFCITKVGHYGLQESFFFIYLPSSFFYL